MDVADLLLLRRSLRLDRQGALEGDRAIDAPPQEDHVLRVSEQMTQLLTAAITPIKYLQGSRS